jgi:sugar phosphate isomerase/epimerase
MKTSAVVWCIHKLLDSEEMTQNEFVVLCAGMGIDGVDLFDHLISGVTAKERASAIEELSAVLNKNNMELASYIVHNDFTDRKDHEKNLKKVKRAIVEAKFLNAHAVRVLGGSTCMLNGQSRKEGLKSVIIGLKKAVHFAEENRVILTLENHGDLPGTADEMLTIVNEIDSPNLKLCYDAGNFLAGNMDIKQDPLEALKKVVSHVYHVHIKDRRFKPGARGDVESCIAGTGAVPLNECLKVLSENAYDGYISCECEGEEGLNVLTTFSNSVANIETAIERAFRQ